MDTLRDIEGKVRRERETDRQTERGRGLKRWCEREKPMNSGDDQVTRGIY